ncbi:hypothetical protein EX30DRAFT_289413, partial [Ascodesmis nigricans]
LAKLSRAKGAAFNSQHWEHMSLCLPDTRVALLEEILEWCRNSAGGPCIYWLNGMAGTGKSTIARTIARSCYGEKRLGASFFFSTGHADLKNARKFLTTIALQLGDSIPNLQPLLCEAIIKNPDISNQSKREQWNHLIFNPLFNLRETTPQAFVVVIDALDECDGEDDIQLILQLLSQANALPITHLKVFVTSRPEIPIRKGFRDMAAVFHRDLVLQDVPREIIDHDIAVYFREELKDLELDSQDLIHLVEKAGGLFIWAATACRFIKGAPLLMRKRLSLLLRDRNVQQNPEEELDKIYTRILSDSIKGTYEQDEYEYVFTLFRRIVGTIILLFNPLAMNDLSRLLGISAKEISLIIGDLHSVLDIGEDVTRPIRQLHLSFRNFLLNEERCRDFQLRVDESKAHHGLLLDCLNQMSEILRTDIGNFRRPGISSSEVEKLDVVKEVLPQHIQYACRYWVYHLERSDIVLRDDDHVHTFLRNHFLHWLEALSLMGMMSESILAIQTLESILLGNSGNCDQLKELVNDAKRFTLSNRWTIERFPLQAYCSALIFTPTQSIVRKHFSSSIPKFIETYPLVHDFWDPLLQSLEGHSDSVLTLAFSPDGKILASGSRDKTVRLWDPATGDSLGTLEGHSD